MSTISPGQCRAARALLDWTQATLAEKAGVSQSTIKDFEKCGGRKLIQNNRSAIERAFHEAGVAFEYSAEGKATGITWESEPGKPAEDPGSARGKRRDTAARGPRGK
jgi:transcriptional regulator with XRE-family HTH domain